MWDVCVEVMGWGWGYLRTRDSGKMVIWRHSFPLSPTFSVLTTGVGSWNPSTSVRKKLYDIIYHYGLDECLETNIRGTRVLRCQVLGGSFCRDLWISWGMLASATTREMLVVSLGHKTPRRSCMGGKISPQHCIWASMRNPNQACLRPQQWIYALSTSIFLTYGERCHFAFYNSWECCHLKHSSNNPELLWEKRKKKATTIQGSLANKKISQSK